MWPWHEHHMLPITPHESRLGSLASSRGSKLGYYRAPQACVNCRRSKTRCMVAQHHGQCIRCAKKGRHCVFQTVDKVVPASIDSRASFAVSTHGQQKHSFPFQTENFVTQTAAANSSNCQDIQANDEYFAKFGMYSYTHDTGKDVTRMSIPNLVPGSHSSLHESQIQSRLQELETRSMNTEQMQEWLSRSPSRNVAVPNK